MRVCGPVLATLVALVCAHAAGAQPLTVRVLETRADGVRLEVTAAWAVPLATAAEAAHVRALSPGAISALAQGEPAAEHVVTLPALAAPRVTVVATEGETLALPDDGGARYLVGEAARASEPGLARGQAVATVAVRMLAYDVATNRLTRHRRVVVDVRYGAPAEAARAAQRVDGLSPRALGGAKWSLHGSVSRSVLASGTFFKIPIREEGMYRIDRDVLAAMGLNAATVDPNRVRVFGNGGAPVPALNSSPRPVDLVENGTRVVGGGDGRFDDGDAVIFYARGVQSWSAGPQGAWQHTTHPYATESYVFVTVGEATGARPAAAPVPASVAAERTSVEGRFVAEFDDFNWAKEGGSGLTWWTNRIAPGVSRDLVASSALVGLSPGEIRWDGVAAIRTVGVSPSARLLFVAGGATLYETGAGYVGTEAESEIASATTVRFTQPYAGGAFSLSHRIGTFPAGTQNEAAVDYLRAFYTQSLTAQSGYLRFVTPRDAAGGAAFVLSGFASAPEVWDVTDAARPERIAAQASGGGYRIAIDATTPREIVAFTDGAARKITARPARVKTQNLHGLTGTPDLVIVVPDTFRAFAEELAAHRRTQGLRVEVATVEAVYNEFSGGQMDPRAIRDYFKFLYDRAPRDADRLRYALLFGDGHFNYRALGTASNLKNWVPPFETAESLDPINSYTSDDYFALLDDSEGRWFGGERTDIAIGRLPVQTAGDARAVVGKLKRYDDPATFGAWRTRYLFTADDDRKGSAARLEDYDLHTQNADLIADYVTGVAPKVDVRKVYGISYERVFLSKWKLPGAHDAIIAAIREGALMFNYFGHGGPEQLADEDLFTKADAEALDNGDRLPIFITATCSFGRWDKDDDQSGAEALVLNAGGGGVAAFTTVRLVFTSTDPFSNNPGVNRRLTQALLARTPDGVPPRIGDALLFMKRYNSEQGGEAVGQTINGRKFNLLGDPSMRFGLPPLEARVERIGGVDVATVDSSTAEQTAAPVRALDRVTVEGTVRRADGSEAADFNGRVSLTVYDAERQVTFRSRLYMLTPYYLVREDLVWRGDVAATNGRFNAAFVVPKDISYSNRLGRITAYAYGSDTHGAGATTRLRVGGTNPNPIADQEGPRIGLFLGDTTFVSGGLAPTRTPELIVRLDDASGINTVGAGVGHELLLVVNGDETKAIDVGNLFRADPGASGRGEVRVELAGLRDGENTVRVRAWDAANNASESTLAFTVAGDEAFTVRRVLNFPNPTTGATRFTFEHNARAGTAARVSVRVFTVGGQLVRALRDGETLPSGGLTSGRVTIPWDGRDEDGDRLAPGVYLYKVRVETDGENRQVAEHVERLVVVR